MRFAARFDDATDQARSFVLAEPVADFRADTIGDVSRALADAEAAASAGLWVAGFVAYEAAPAFDLALRVASARLGSLPLAWFTAFRHRRAIDPPAWRAAATPPRWTAAISAEDHATAIARIRELIAAGTTYQVNLTTQLRGRVDDPNQLYGQMLAAQPVRFGALLTFPTHAVVSASPELFFETSDDRIITRPMKGTARRGRWPDEDDAAGHELRASPKERAENVMVVDLIRNDLGRIATVGSVAVDELFTVEAYPTLWQMTSTVSARLPPATTLTDVFAALFPSGSVTGTPKVSAMAAIAELEALPRGVYCGAVGYIEPGPGLRARFSVAIRTAVVDRTARSACFGSGGGITWSSNPASEWAELLAKTELLHRGAAAGGLVETMRRDDNGTIANLDRHLARLAASARVLGIPLDPELARAATGECGEPGRVRLLLGRDGQLTSTTADLPAADGGAVRLALLQNAVSSEDRLLFHKLADRSRYERWQAQRPPGVDDVILTNERNEVTETTIANLAVGLDGRWWTPPLSCGLLPGVERGRLLDAGVLGERVIHPIELRGASLALISSLRGWRPAVLV